MIGRTNALAGGGIDVSSKPNIDFDGKWSGWHIEIYEDKPYWEALFSSSGTLTNYDSDYTCDAWGIGGGGAGGVFYEGGYSKGNGAGSGYTNMAEGLTLPNKTTAITIGAGGSTLATGTNSNTDIKGGNGGTTTFLTLSCSGGKGGSGTSKAGGNGGSNGSTGWGYDDGGANGTPGAGKIMSKFWSTEHNTEYGVGGWNTNNGDGYDENGGGGGGYLDVGANGSTSGHGYGGGGGGANCAASGILAEQFYDWRGKSGCLIIRIPI